MCKLGQRGFVTSPSCSAWSIASASDSDVELRLPVCGLVENSSLVALAMGIRYCSPKSVHCACDKAMIYLGLRKENPQIRSLIRLFAIFQHPACSLFPFIAGGVGASHRRADVLRWIAEGFPLLVCQLFEERS